MNYSFKIKNITLKYPEKILNISIAVKTKIPYKNFPNKQTPKFKISTVKQFLCKKFWIEQDLNPRPTLG